MKRLGDRGSVAAELALALPAVLIALLLIWRPLSFDSLDPQSAAARGVPTTAVSLLFMLLLTIGLFFGGRASNPRDGRIYAGALMIFTIIFGLGVSPIPTTAPESFATRMGMLLVAIAIAGCGMGLLWRAAPAPVSGPNREVSS